MNSKGNDIDIGKTIPIILVLIIIAGMLLVISGTVQLSSLLKPGSVVNAASTINYASNSGQVRDGYLYGSKMSLLITATQSPAEILYSYKGTEQSWGNYKILPQYNMFIKASATPKAESNTNEYRKIYFKDFWGATLQTNERIGTTWRQYTPLHVEIYADANNIPTTPVLVRDIADIDIQGQQLYPLGNGINIQRSSIVLTGSQTLPVETNIIVATAPEYSQFKTSVPGALYPSSSQTYIFDKASYDSKIDSFYNKYSAQFTGINMIQDPLFALWTGYDKFTFSPTSMCGVFSSAKTGDYCKLRDWNGLVNEVTKPTFPLKYDATNQKIIADNIQYGAVINLEIPSEQIKSFAILRGAGKPEVTISVAGRIRQGESMYLTVDVKNIGDTDGFSIVPKSTSGKLLFSPASYTSQSIPYNTQKSFKFVVTVAGKETTELSATESIAVSVQAEHNPDKVTKTGTVNIDYNKISEIVPDSQAGSVPEPTIKPGSADTMDLGNKTAGSKANKVNWYDTTPAKILAGLVAALVILLFWRKQNE